MKTRTETDSASARSKCRTIAIGARRPSARATISASATSACRFRWSHALAIVKRAAAETNLELGLLDARRAKAIIAAAQEIIDGKLDDQFPLVGVADRLRHPDQHERQRGDRQSRQRKARRRRGAKEPIHPNDHVNMSQSSNDSFPTAMHIAAAQEITRRLIPALPHLQAALEDQNKSVRRDRQDRPHPYPGRDAAHARPGIFRLRRTGRSRASRGSSSALKELYPLAQGGTAVGTGLNSKRAIRQAVRAKAAAITGLPFVSAPNKFEALASHGAMAFAHGALNALAADLFKIANDIRFLGSGPALRLWRIDPAGKRAGLVDHARQGQSDPVRSADHGVLPGVRQRNHDRGRGKPGPLRTERVQAGDHLRDAAIDPAARRRRRTHSPITASSAYAPTNRASAN